MPRKEVTITKVQNGYVINHNHTETKISETPEQALVIAGEYLAQEETTV